MYDCVPSCLRDAGEVEMSLMGSMEFVMQLKGTNRKEQIHPSSPDGKSGTAQAPLGSKPSLDI